MKLGLQISAVLENVTGLKPDGDDFRWYLKLKCSNCGDETEEFVYLSLSESQPLKGGRGHASLVIKCKLCVRENSIDIIRESIASYNDEDSPNYKTIVVFDCRGVEAIEYDARVGWVAEGSESGTKFEEVDLSQREWYDFDETAKLSVGVTDFKHQFVRV